MTVTATEFKTNFGKYLEKARDEDVYITKNGRRVAKVSNPARDKLDALDKLVGIVPKEMRDKTLDDIRAERLARQ